MEQLESRCAPSGVANPDVVQVTLGQGGFPYLGSDVRAVEWALRIGIFFDQGSYHGPDTVYEVHIPDGRTVQGSAGVYHHAFGMLGGVVPYVGISTDLTADQAAPGMAFDLHQVAEGNFFTDG